MESGSNGKGRGSGSTSQINSAVNVIDFVTPTSFSGTSTISPLISTTTAISDIIDDINATLTNNISNNSIESKDINTFVTTRTSPNTIVNSGTASNTTGTVTPNGTINM